MRLKKKGLLSLLFCFIWLPGTWASEIKLPILAVQQAQTDQVTLIDTRHSAFYNGWQDEHFQHSSTGGHLSGALNLSASWLTKMDEITWKEWQSFHNVNIDTPIALYGSIADVEQVAAFLQAHGFNTVFQLPPMKKIIQDNPLIRLPQYQQLVHPAWLHALRNNIPVEAPPVGHHVLIEVNWGEPKEYLQGHIPGADYLDTGEIESEPLWNVVSAQKLEETLLKHGITAETTVILYSREIMAAGRAAHTMLYAGVKDVRILDGGWQAWIDSGFPIESGTGPLVMGAVNFGASIPVHPEIMLNMKQARALTFRADASLVSVRSWPEFIGQTSGYTYIEAKGDIPGARWGRLGRDAYHMDDYLNPDGTLRTADDISQMWREWNILPSQEVSFYCGTGWGAAMAYFYAWVMGWQNISVYDGGWMEWSADKNNPQVRGMRDPQ